MDTKVRERELIILKEIAETLNQCNDMREMLNAVLQKLLNVTDLRSGWIFLTNGSPDYVCVADHLLPPALLWKDKTPMCNGESCWCLGQLWNGQLPSAVNIIECKRLENAITYGWGDTQGITHHATVPLRAGGIQCGVLNVAAPGKCHFTKEELALLQAVAFQIGTAIERTKLYHEQEKRALHFIRLEETLRQLDDVRDVSLLPDRVVASAVEAFGWSHLYFFVQDDSGGFESRAAYKDGKVLEELASIRGSLAFSIMRALEGQRNVWMTDQSDLAPLANTLGFERVLSVAMSPVRIHHRTYGLLMALSSKQDALDVSDRDVLESLAEHVSLAIENLRVEEQRRANTRLEERTRLARDLHDSVNQYLFSLSMIAGGLRSSKTSDDALLREPLVEIQRLAQLALTEMRALIGQLRPVGLERGLLTGLRSYAEMLGLHSECKISGLIELAPSVEESLWRISQEAINNVAKHARTDRVFLELRSGRSQITLLIRDKGCGFSLVGSGRKDSYGLHTMRERAESMGGSFSVESGLTGTTITVTIPRISTQ